MFYLLSGFCWDGFTSFLRSTSLLYYRLASIMEQVKKYVPLLKQIIFFGFVGFVTLGIDVTVTTTLYNVAHFPAYMASAIGFLSGFFFNFPMNRKRVFRHSSKDKFSLRAQVAMYVSLSLFNLAATSALVELLVVHDVVRIAIAKLLVTALISMWNFVLFKTIIFSKLAVADVERLAVQ